LALRSYPQFVPSAIEVDAKEKSYSIITLGKIKKLYPKAKIFFVLGIDAFLEIDTWKNHENVLEQCFFVVISRPGFQLRDAETAFSGMRREKMFELPEPEIIKDDVLLKFRIFLMPIDALNIASTDIRKKLRRGESVKTMVPDVVVSYIKENNLYQS
jgi:nicotinate-nucleotide adenylyltransferase